MSVGIQEPGRGEPFQDAITESGSEWAEKSAVSRLPKHKPAGVENGTKKGSIANITFPKYSRTTSLATKPGMMLREEATRVDDGEVKARSWSEVTKEWRSWMDEALHTSAVFESIDRETGEELERTVPLQNRFMEKRQTELYAKLKDLERGARSAYQNLSVAMLTFTASNRSGAGDWERCPGNHLDDLLSTWPLVRRELSRALDGRRFEYLRMLEPHESGYAHVHLAVFVDGKVPERAFQSVMDRHVSNCLAASSDAHRPENGAVSVRESVENVAGYVAGYLMKWGENARQAPENVQRFNALLWATGSRRWSASDGAQEWMAFETPEPVNEWELTHVEIRQERYPLDEKNTGVVMLPLTESGRGLDPPPVRG